MVSDINRVHQRTFSFKVVASQSRGAFINSVSVRPSPLVKQLCRILARIRVDDIYSIVTFTTDRFV